MKTYQGTVVGIIDQQTIKVKTVNIRMHPVYKKRVKRTKSFLVHVRGRLPELGKRLSFVEVKPISKLKKWATEETK